jgi:hypothetical protein
MRWLGGYKIILGKNWPLSLFKAFREDYQMYTFLKRVLLATIVTLVTLLFPFFVIISFVVCK